MRWANTIKKRTKNIMTTNNLIDLRDLTIGQHTVLEAIHRDDIKNVVWVGPPRCGKTAGYAMALMEMVLSDRILGMGNGQYIFAGQTMGSIKRNMYVYLQDIGKQYGVTVKDVGGEDAHISIGGFAKVFVFGGDNMRSWQKPQGLTIMSAILDEATLLNEEFVSVVKQRLSFGESKLLLGMNRSDPWHFIKRQWIDDSPPNTLIIDSDFWENHHHAMEQKLYQWHSIKSKWERERIFGTTWAPREGLIFPIETSMVKDIAVPEYGGVIGYDWGGAADSVGLRFVKVGPNAWHIANEYVHRSKNKLPLSDAQHLRIMSSLYRPEWYIVDPSAYGFRAASLEMGYTCQTANNDFDYGIQTVQNALRTGRLTISPKCEYLLGCCAAYIYDEKTGKPIKGVYDHGPDAMRYGVTILMPHMAATVVSGA